MKKHKIEMLKHPSLTDIMEKNARLRTEIRLLCAALITWIGIAAYLLHRGCL